MEFICKTQSCCKQTEFILFLCRWRWFHAPVKKVRSLSQPIRLFVLFSPAAGLRGGPVEAADAEDAGAFKQRRICQLRCWQRQSERAADAWLCSSPVIKSVLAKMVCKYLTGWWLTEILHLYRLCRTRSLDPDWSFQFQLARYRPGDLGFVPRPALKHKNVLPRMEAGSSRFVRTSELSFRACRGMSDHSYSCSYYMI